MKRAHVSLMMVLALAMALIVGPAYGADKGGVYIGVKGGYEYKDGTGSLTDTASTAAAGLNNNATNKKWKDESGYAVGGAVGYNFAGYGVPVRAEAEYMYHSQFKNTAQNATTGTFSSKIDIQTLFANFYYDIKTGTAFTPYVGAGLGVAWINQKISSNFTNGATTTWAANGDHDVTNFAWNVGAGVGYSLTDNIILDLGYRFTSFGDAKGVSSGTVSYKAKDLQAHEGLLGLRYQF